MTDPRPLSRADLAEFLPNQRAIRAFEQLFKIIPADLLELLKRSEEAHVDALTALARAVSMATRALAATPEARNVMLVSELWHLPTPVAGVIQLEDNRTYWFTTTVDLEGARLVGGRNTTIVGSSSENCHIKSTGLTLGTALLSSEWSLPMRHITLNAPTILNLDATANAGRALDWYGVNFEGSTDVGLIKNYTNFVAASLAFLGASGLVFDGTMGTIGITDTLFSAASTGTLVTIPSTATITRRFRVSYSSAIVAAPATGFDVSASASIPVEGYIFDTCNFSGGGTYTAGVTYDDNKARWGENRGIKNSAALTGYYMFGNATATTIGAIATPVLVAGTTTEAAISQRFTVSTTNRATYAGAVVRDFKVTAVFSLTSGNGHQISCYIAKNGVVLSESETYLTTSAAGRLENGGVHVTLELTDGDYVEMFVENNTSATDITVEDLNLIIESLN